MAARLRVAPEIPTVVGSSRALLAPHRGGRGGAAVPEYPDRAERYRLSLGSQRRWPCCLAPRHGGGGWPAERSRQGIGVRPEGQRLGLRVKSTCCHGCDRDLRYRAMHLREQLSRRRLEDRLRYARPLAFPNARVPTPGGPRPLLLAELCIVLPPVAALTLMAEMPDDLARLADRYHT